MWVANNIYNLISVAGLEVVDGGVLLRTAGPVSAEVRSAIDGMRNATVRFSGASSDVVRLLASDASLYSSVELETVNELATIAEVHEDADDETRSGDGMEMELLPIGGGGGGLPDEERNLVDRLMAQEFSDGGALSRYLDELYPGIDGDGEVGGEDGVGGGDAADGGADNAVVGEAAGGEVNAEVLVEDGVVIDAVGEDDFVAPVLEDSEAGVVGGDECAACNAHYAAMERAGNVG